MEDKKMKELEELCRPVANYLKNNWDPHCTVVITDSHIKLVRDEIGIPVRTAQEVPVQEQSNVSIPSITINLTQQQYEELKKNLLFGLQKSQTHLR